MIKKKCGKLIYRKDKGTDGTTDSQKANLKSLGSADTKLKNTHNYQI